jgi:hypothetical protein
LGGIRFQSGILMWPGAGRPRGFAGGCPMEYAGILLEVLRLTIEMSSSDTLKVILDRNDMRRLNITFEELDYENQATRSILKELLTDAGRLAGFSSKCTRMLIEVFPAPDGGCLLYFTKLSASRQTLS